MNKEEKILVYGYGNPGRQDDALGSEFVYLTNSWIANNQIKNVETDCNYQLNIEDAHKISTFDKIYFVDASQEKINTYIMKQVHPLQSSAFSTHVAQPAYILYLCNEIFKKNPLLYLLHIKGYKWNFMSPITEKAKKICKLLFRILRNKFSHRSLL